MICIYEHKGGPGIASLGSGGAPAVETWRTRAVLRGHANNVVDLGWSPDDSRLASASLDNTVWVWDTATWSMLRRLDFHTSFVKGLAWDPVGTYLATQVSWCGVELGGAAARGALVVGRAGTWLLRLVGAVAFLPLSSAAAAAARRPLSYFANRPRRRRLQSEDKSVVIWRCDDWSVQARPAPWRRRTQHTAGRRCSGRPQLAPRRMQHSIPSAGAAPASLPPCGVGAGAGEGAVRQAGHLHLLHPHELVPRWLLPGHRWVWKTGCFGGTGLHPCRMLRQPEGLHPSLRVCTGGRHAAAAAAA